MTQKRFSPVWFALPLALAAVLVAGGASGEDLLQIYREAQASDPQLAAARANWGATQERVPQARAALLPNVAVTSSANINRVDSTLHTDPKFRSNSEFGQLGVTVSASQPLYRAQSVVALAQAQQQVVQSDYNLAIAQQDLILRTAAAYFDVLLAEFTVELVEQQKLAVEEQLAQAKRNFEVGTATITDTNEAQAQYDRIIANEIQARNDLDRRRTALRALIGRLPKDLNRVRRPFEPQLPNPNSLEYWLERALADNLVVRVVKASYDIAALEVDRARAANYPTVDLVASYGRSGSTGGGSTNLSGSTGGGSINASRDQRSGSFGLQLNVPLYQGGIVSSRVREAVALLERARQDSEFARRNAVTGAQDGFSGIISAAASVKAFEQALISADTALQSNRLGQEVGIRTNLDVLNVQQNVFSVRRDLANAYFQYLLAILRLKAAVGTLTEADLVEINRYLTV